MVVKEMTLDEKISLLAWNRHGGTESDESSGDPFQWRRGIRRRHSAAGHSRIQMSDAAYGVRSSGENGRYSTALPADVAAAASWDLDAAYEYGA